ncbi:MAG: thioredoxin domain-containing protein, partial [candidate division Zixibacteria bacterium]|nr:thioredoxin domain-containing protein [candidate division Zixibacteria bacterium]
LAHQAAECAGREGRFWPYHDKLFEGQSLWSGPVNPAETFLRYARDTGLNLDRFAACLTDKNVTAAVARSKGEGNKLQIRSTPTFFVNGQRVVGAVELQNRGEAIIREVLKLPPAAANPPAPLPAGDEGHGHGGPA